MRKASRRQFLLAGGAAMAALAQRRDPAPATGNPAVPDRVTAFEEGTSAGLPLVRSGNRWQVRDIEVVTEPGAAGMPVVVSAPKTRLTKVRLRWEGTTPHNGAHFLGDAWERGYGDFEWRGISGERIMPWYFLTYAGGRLSGTGVQTGAGAICSWQADDGGTTLWLDVSNGGAGVELGERRLEAATIVRYEPAGGESPWESARAFCRLMCSHPTLPAQPMYGSNNWYYAYGKNTSAAGILKDAALMAELAPAASNRPYVVIDMGWGAQPEGAGPVAQLAPGYPDMADLARRMKSAGVRPGIWTRPLLTAEKRAQSWRLPPTGGRRNGSLATIDPSIPEALAYVGDSIAEIRSWGYDLIKHDYSTFDLTGRWGFAMGPDLTARGWHFHDRGRTTAEIMVDLYRTIRRRAGDAAILGCNTIGHLAAGLEEAQRIGDDTSGREWGRTRKMGINSLAFRMPQHSTFFDADPDCVPVTREIPWELTRQWLDLVARSGMALFISADPDAVRAEYKPELKAALEIASRAQSPGVPLDWMETTTPESWRFATREARYHWYLDE